jgi:hypothetical protein
MYMWEWAMKGRERERFVGERPARDVGGMLGDIPAFKLQLISDTVES